MFTNRCSAAWLGIILVLGASKGTETGRKRRWSRVWGPYEASITRDCLPARDFEACVSRDRAALSCWFGGVKTTCDFPRAVTN